MKESSATYKELWLQDKDNPCLTPKQEEALNFLADKGLSAQKSINEIKGLSDKEVTVLMEFWDKGLRGNHLRQLLNKENLEPLKYLMTRDIELSTSDANIDLKALTPDAAILEINGLSLIQAVALIALWDKGLRGHHLRAWQPNEHEPLFCDAHTMTLRYLIREKELTPEAAIQELNKLSYNQAEALMALYDDGLRGDHLRTWKGEKERADTLTPLQGDLWFPWYQKQMLKILIRRDKCSPEDAMNLIKGKVVRTRPQQESFTPLLTATKQPCDPTCNAAPREKTISETATCSQKKETTFSKN